MKKFSSKIKDFGHFFDKRAVRVIITLASLILFVLAAGAPGGLGGVGMQSVESSNDGEQCGVSTSVLEHINQNGLNHMSPNALNVLCLP